MRIFVAALIVLAAFPAANASDDAGLLAACPTSAGAVSLVSGVTVVGTDTAAQDCHYKINVASVAFMRLRANLTFNGDHDVYVKRGAPASTGPYFCSGASFSATDEQCMADLSLTGDYFIRAKRWSGTSDFNLTAFVEEIPPTCGLGHGVHTLAPGSVTTTLTSDVGAFCMFRYTPAAGTDFVRFTLTPTTSDFDLYTRKGAQPNATLWDCRPFFPGTASERCEHVVDGAQPYFVMVHRFSGSGAFTLEAEDVVIPIIEPGEVTRTTLADGALAYYKVVVPQRNELGRTMSMLTIAIAGGAEDAACAFVEPARPGTCAAAGLARSNADLFVRWKHGLPSASVNDCGPSAPGSTGACVFQNETAAAAPELAELAAARYLGPGKYFIAVRATAGPADVAITVAHA